MNDKRLHNILIAILDMLLLLFIFFLGVNAMIWTIGQLEEIKKDCCTICISQSQGKSKNYVLNSSIVSSVNR